MLVPNLWLYMQIALKNEQTHLELYTGWYQISGCAAYDWLVYMQKPAQTHHGVCVCVCVCAALDLVCN